MGGMEAHAHQLCSALRDSGHDVTLLAAGGSSDPRLQAICDEPYEAVLPWEHWRGTAQLEAYQRRAFATAMDVVRNGQFDVVHNNALFPDLIDWLRESGIPAVTSQHVPPFGKMAEAVARTEGCEWAQLTCTSRSQLPLWFADPPANAGVVYNGIDCNKWRPGNERSGRLVWTGRITPNKGLRESIEAVRRADAALDFAGPVEDRAYFQECMSAANGADIRYLGQLQGETLSQVVRCARAALVTPMWDEPFGLVAAEALASGVPVCAFDRGAMREVIGPCGLLAGGGDVEGLAECIGQVDRIDRQSCRTRALDRFSAQAMVAGYEQAYTAAIRGSQIGVDAASSSSCASTAALLA